MLLELGCNTAEPEGQTPYLFSVLKIPFAIIHELRAIGSALCPAPPYTLVHAWRRRTMNLFALCPFWDLNKKREDSAGATICKVSWSYIVAVPPIPRLECCQRWSSRSNLRPRCRSLLGSVDGRIIVLDTPWAIWAL